MKPRPEPLRLTLAAKFEDLQQSEAGWTYRMWAQYYNLVNDRGWLFFNGCFRKTIAERVSKNRVKIHDGHNWSSTASNNLGRVLSAEETPRGCRYVGFLSRSEEAIAQKISDGTVDENSVEIELTKAEKIERPIEDVPERIRPFVEISTEGLAILTGVREVMWWAIGLVSSSSQDRDAIISVPVAVSFQDLPVSLARWDPVAAKSRVKAWSGEGNTARLSRAHLVQLPGGSCFGQVADVVDGELVLVAESLESAYEDVSKALNDRLADQELAETLAAVGRHIGRYDEKKSLTVDFDGGTHVGEGADMALTALPGGGEPPPATPEAEPTGTRTHSDEGSNEARLGLLLLTAKLQRLRHRARGSDRDSAGTGGRNSREGEP